MHTKNWTQVKELLHHLMTLERPARDAYLDNAGVASEIRAEVESLLGFEEASESLMNVSAVEMAKDFFDEDAAIGQVFGVYRVISEIGYGGMGTVFLAERTDGKFEQKVALKVLKRELNTAAMRRRFQREREILAALEHPGIARLLDAGTTEDKVPFIAMEYVEGLPIDVYCSKHEADLYQRLDLFRKVCAAVDFAHRNLIVHRDLKPSNILVTEDGTPKLLDFGISKILSADMENAATVTRFGVMTPSYASPEQLRNESVTTATDVYSLGVILYELLSGHRPFENKENNLKEIYQAVVDTDPPLPSSLVETISKNSIELSDAETEVIPIEPVSHPSRTKPGRLRHTSPQTIRIKPQYLRGDLDNIVLKALKKEPERRYSSAENFSDDINRHLNGLPVTARPDTFSYRAEKFIKRNRISVFAATLVFLAITGGVFTTLWQAERANAERVKAEKRFNDVRTLANSFLFEFSPLVENLPGSTPARKLLVTRALEYLDNLSQESAGDAQLQSELADAYEKVGDVQGNPFNPNIGDVKGAVQSYQKALSIREKLSGTDQNGAALQKGLANVYEKLGGTQFMSGDYDKAVGLFDKALALREDFVARDENNFEARANLAKVLRSRGLIPFNDGDNKKALEYYNRSKDIYEKLNRQQPENDQIAHEYSYMFVAIGEALGWDNKPGLSGESLQKGLELLIPLSEKYPNNHSFQRSLHLAYVKRGEYYEEEKDYDKAVASFTRALEIAQKSSQADPQSFQSKRDTALAYKKLAQSLDLAGKSSESLEKLTLALNIFRELGASDPNNSGTLYDIANTRFSIGETYLTMKDFETALSTFQTAKSEFETVRNVNPDDIYATRMSSYNIDRIGLCYETLAEKGDKQELLQKALENFRTALISFNKMNADGNLGEYDQAALPSMETKIKQIESRLAK